jgi:hypothetical protein
MFRAKSGVFAGFAVGSVDGRVALQVSYSSNLNDIGSVSISCMHI